VTVEVMTLQDGTVRVFTTRELAYQAHNDMGQPAMALHTIEVEGLKEKFFKPAIEAIVAERKRMGCYDGKDRTTHENGVCVGLAGAMLAIESLEKP
jgi:hypothetical protein